MYCKILDEHTFNEVLDLLSKMIKENLKSWKSSRWIRVKFASYCSVKEENWQNRRFDILSNTFFYMGSLLSIFVWLTGYDVDINIEAMYNLLGIKTLRFLKSFFSADVLSIEKLRLRQKSSDIWLVSLFVNLLYIVFQKNYVYINSFHIKVSLLYTNVWSKPIQINEIYA